MHELTPEQQQQVEAIDSRGEEIRAQITDAVAALANNPSDWDQAEIILNLCEEIEELARALNAIIPLDPSAEPPPIDFAKARRDIDYLRRRDEPTDAELELAELVEQMVAKHSTIIPDFEAFYQLRKELEDRIAKREQER